MPAFKLNALSLPCGVLDAALHRPLLSVPGRRSGRAALRSQGSVDPLVTRITRHNHPPFSPLHPPAFTAQPARGRDRIVVSTLRCGRSNPGSNPGHGSAVNIFCVHLLFQQMSLFCELRWRTDNGVGGLEDFQMYTAYVFRASSIQWLS